ncbi:hypothetical protein [Zooshikella sp. RANM57]|uniref:hypothetical protein n=1 Tax=Zooshikella sp. RANM57 TaxID=3425863 RepID=UPI003D6E78F6
MNRTLLITAILAAFTAAVHIFVGTPEIQEPLLQSNLPKNISLLLYSCWHLVSITLVVSAAAFYISARGKLTGSSLPMVKLTSCMWLCFGLVFIVVALLFSGPSMLITLPQWTLVIPVGLLGLWGCSKQ